MTEHKHEYMKKYRAEHKDSIKENQKNTIYLIKSKMQNNQSCTDNAIKKNIENNRDVLITKTKIIQGI